MDVKKLKITNNYRKLMAPFTIAMLAVRSLHPRHHSMLCWLSASLSSHKYYILPELLDREPLAACSLAGTIYKVSRIQGLAERGQGNGQNILSNIIPEIHSAQGQELDLSLTASPTGLIASPYAPANSANHAKRKFSLSLDRPVHQWPSSTFSHRGDYSNLKAIVFCRTMIVYSIAAICRILMYRLSAMQPKTSLSIRRRLAPVRRRGRRTAMRVRVPSNCHARIVVAVVLSHTSQLRCRVLLHSIMSSVQPSAREVLFQRSLSPIVRQQDHVMTLASGRCNIQSSQHSLYATDSLPARFSHVGIVPDDTVVRRVFSMISRFPRLFILALPHTHLTSPSSALTTSLLRAVQVSPLQCGEEAMWSDWCRLIAQGLDMFPNSLQTPATRRFRSFKDSDKMIKKLNTMSAYTRQKAKLKYRNRIRLERASQKQSSATPKIPNDRVKRCWERKIYVKAVRGRQCRRNLRRWPPRRASVCGEMNRRPGLGQRAARSHFIRTISQSSVLKVNNNSSSSCSYASPSAAGDADARTSCSAVDASVGNRLLYSDWLQLIASQRSIVKSPYMTFSDLWILGHKCITGEGMRVWFEGQQLIMCVVTFDFLATNSAKLCLHEAEEYRASRTSAGQCCNPARKVCSLAVARLNMLQVALTTAAGCLSLSLIVELNTFNGDYDLDHVSSPAKPSLRAWRVLEGLCLRSNITGGYLNSNCYTREVLDHEVLSLLQATPPAIFQQDNTRPHVTRNVQAFFNKRCVPLLPWTARSPDMSPMEHVWDMSGRRPYRHGPPATTVQGPRRPIHSAHIATVQQQRYSVRKENLCTVTGASDRTSLEDVTLRTATERCVSPDENYAPTANWHLSSILERGVGGLYLSISLSLHVQMSGIASETM
ncbi:hypothetical protein PR048_015314 [Dryococelus australis]|uniref:Uncharacterized protein n=1 Tax=Dryococelus australis TaxID=614101 RepID=A0ABQ9HGL9_9NEOP|nr:hypothetical protein PR048_015314 [Dryococelus australis]